MLVRQRIYRTLPVFTLYMGWNVCIDLAGGIVLFLGPQKYLLFYLIQLTIDAIYQFRILTELARSVRRHNRARSPGPVLLALLFPIAAAIIWQSAAWTEPPYCTIMGRILVHMLQAYSILRAGFVLALVLWSALLGLRWPGRELCIITGFGFYSIVALTVSILHTHQTVGPMYHLLDLAVNASYICSLLYWIYSFAPRVPESRTLLFTNASSAMDRNRSR